MCHNQNSIYIGYKNNQPYCRKCIRFINGQKADDTISYKNQNVHANLNYSLSFTQKKASKQILNYVKQNQNVIVNAVCGAGKTELVYETIEYIINLNKKVAFAIPRKDVCIEIYERLKKDYPNLKICLVYGEHHHDLNGQLVILTTHQLYRYPNYFDLLILDEADAFPYYHNDLLESFLKNSVHGPIIFLSATLKKQDLKNCNNIVYVNCRFHQMDLPVPKIIHYNFLNKIQVLKKIIQSINSFPILIFVPTIKLGKELSIKLQIPFVYSSLNQKTEWICKFKNKEISKLITTSILERGITFENVQVIVYEANHLLFDVSSLIQISGRVGRKIKYPTGKVFFLSNQTSEDMKQCIKEIKMKNLAIV